MSVLDIPCISSAACHRDRRYRRSITIQTRQPPPSDSLRDRDRRSLGPSACPGPGYVRRRCHGGIGAAVCRSMSGKLRRRSRRPLDAAVVHADERESVQRDATQPTRSLGGRFGVRSRSTPPRTAPILDIDAVDRSTSGSVPDNGTDPDLDAGDQPRSRIRAQNRPPERSRRAIAPKPDATQPQTPPFTGTVRRHLGRVTPTDNTSPGTA
jgi:hypothetical protein